jgi:hypothetical protein
MRDKAVAILSCLIAAGVVLWATSAVALTADELVQLKEAGVAEAIIIVMVESNYTDVTKVLRLRQAGFQDDTILAVIRTDLKQQGGTISPPAVPTQAGQPSTPPVPQSPVLCQILADVEITRHLLYRGDRIQNQDRHDDATFTVRKGALEVTWPPPTGFLSALRVLRRDPFPQPFHWELDPTDSLYYGGDPERPYTFISTPQHRGKPPTDGQHYWVIKFKPRDERFLDCLLQAGARKVEPRGEQQGRGAPVGSPVPEPQAK